jgi:thioredoxin 1
MSAEGAVGLFRWKRKKRSQNAPIATAKTSRCNRRYRLRFLPAAPEADSPESDSENGGTIQPKVLWRGGNMSKALPLNDADFSKEVSESSLPVLVDFWATWCGPCQTMGPILDSVAEEYDGKLKVMKVNVDSNPLTPSKFGIRGIPTLVLFKGGEVVDRIVGAVPRNTVDTLIKKALV